MIYEVRPEASGYDLRSASKAIGGAIPRQILLKGTPMEMIRNLRSTIFDLRSLKINQNTYLSSIAGRSELKFEIWNL